jgi:cell division protein FtsW (lipid II flippase)/membrane peptidoglycan carboxypeptidase
VAIIIEMSLFALVAVAGYFGVNAAVDAATVKAQSATTGIRSLEEVQEAARLGYLMFLAGVGALALARFISLKRGRGNVFSPFVLPAACMAAGIGLALQMGYGNPLTHQFWPGPQFAQGILIAAALAALIIVLPRDPVEIAAPVEMALPFLMAATFVALRLFGKGTEAAPDTLINLGPIQPLEIVKVVFVLYLALYFGRRAAQLRFQRDRILGVDFPRRKILIPAVLIMVLLFGAFVMVKDLGATLILSAVFLAMFYIVTRAGGWVILALAIVAGGVAIATHVPAITQSPKVTLRLQMWLDPWYNAIPFGDQTARARWAIAAGGFGGRGLGAAPATALPAGHTDLVQAHLTEEMGAAGMIVYLVLLAAIAAQGLWIAAWNRTPERMLLAAGLSIFLIAQWAVIFAGTTGLLPLTGVVVPFLSWGKTGMIVFMLTAAMIARLAESGHARESTVELDEVRKGTMATMAAELLLLAGGVVVIVLEAVVWGPATTVRGVVTFLAPQPGDPYDRIVNLHDPRLQIIADRMKRGEIHDRNGEVIAGTDPETGERTYPLGDAMGTLLGPPEAIVLRPEWMIERQLDGILRGYGDLPDGPAVWMAEKADGGERFLFVVKTRDPLPEERERALKMAEGDEVRLLALSAPDFRPLLPLMRASREQLQKVYDDIPSRTATITIDAKLQQQTAQILKEAARKGKAGAAVVLDADTGHVLARAQWPDFDPGSERFMRRLTDPDFPVKDKKFTGVYGPWPDKTGTRGVFQAGSVAKVVTSIIAARAGLLGTANQRVVKTGPIFPCKLHDGQGPYFTRPGWYKPIHDHPEDPMHGDVDFIRGLAVSCNVYFGQLGLQLGVDAFKQLVAAGVEIGWDGKTINPGKPGSRELAETAFGQAAALLSVSQLARVGGTVASGGIYRKCGPGMDKNAPCEERKILDDPNRMVPVLSGMESVVLAGTARGLQVPAGVRLYGKTGTADAIGTRDEIVFGVPYNEWGSPNSWFLGIAEDAKAVPDQALTPHRIVAAVVVPRGGLGARVSGPAAMEILAAAQSLGYITPRTAPGAAPGMQPTIPIDAPGASPAPGTARSPRPVTIISPVLATPTPSPRPPGAAPAGAPPAAAAPSAAAPAPRTSPPASAAAPPAPAVTPRPPAATPAASPAATPTPRPSPPAAEASPTQGP